LLNLGSGSFLVTGSHFINFYFPVSTYEIWKVLISLAIFVFIANFHVLGLFIPKKSDALVGRV
jgi:hypothetical protein